MTTVLVRRPARLLFAGHPNADEPLVIAAPPQQNDQSPGATNVAMIIMPLISGSGSLLITLTNRERPLFATAGLLFMVVSVGLGIVMFVGTRSGARRRQREHRERYLDYLEDVRRTVREAAAAQRAQAALRHPEPDALLDLSRLPARRWERRPGDADFLDIRAGVGVTPLTRGLSMSADRSNPLLSYDPVCLNAAQSLVDSYAELNDQPITLPLGEIGSLSVVGDRGRGRALVRALLGQLVALHPPDALAVALVRSPAVADQWEWVKWLPHSRTGSGDDLLVFNSTGGLLDRLAEDLKDRRAEPERRGAWSARPGRRHLLVVIDGEFQYGTAHSDLTTGGSRKEPGMTTITLVAHRREEPEQVDHRIILDSLGAATGGSILRVVDEIAVPAMSALARSLSPVRLAEDDDVEMSSPTGGLREILGVSDVATLDPRRSWQPGSPRDFLRVPIGIGTTGQPVYLDLKESARAGMGPHGLVVGATGSGKSELLRTMVTSLVIAHPPERLALLLVDFKGGATFAGFTDLPHMAGLVTNLAADPGLVQRFRDALFGELTRRQRILADAGNLPNLQAYAELVERSAGPGFPEPLPHLLVIIDEFTELLTARPDFAELFLAVGRIGRSIGIHLLLATQRLDPGKIRGLESHLSYRISLRTFSEAESREALGVADAYHLPPEPGAGYLKVDTTVFERFKSALISAPYRGPVVQARSVPAVVAFSTTPGNGALQRSPTQRSEEEDSTRTILDVAVRRLTDAGAEQVRPVWIAPLPRALALDLVPGGADAGQDNSAEQSGTAEVSAVLGLTDFPAEQRQSPLTWDFTGPHGNVLIIGAAMSGKSVLLRTMISSLALRYPPGQIALYCLDYGGGSLAAMERLPQVAGACTRGDPDRVRRAVADVLAMLDDREALLGRSGWDGAGALRLARLRGSLPGRVLGDVFLVVDGWAAFREAEPDLEDQVMTIAHRGPSLGIHTILTASTGSQVRMRLATALPGRIELRLTDAFDSTIDRRLAASLPADAPGRALLQSGHIAQIALPRADGASGVDDLPAAVSELLDVVHRRWPGDRVDPVRVLPPIVHLSDLPDLPSRSGRSDGTGRQAGLSCAVPVGLFERDLSPVAVDLFEADAHLQVYGESQAGKTSFLRTLLTQLTRAMTPDELGIVMVDYRRAHLDLVPQDHLLAYCTGAAGTRQAIAEVCQGLVQRMPGPAVTNHQLRARNWWSGREIVIVADDYDLVSTATGNPLAPLIDFLAQGRDVGLHVVTARRTGGASRAMFEPLTQALNDLAGPGLLFSGDRTEGRLLTGVASQRLPPGRALLARRGRTPEQVQIAWAEPV